MTPARGRFGASSRAANGRFALPEQAAHDCKYGPSPRLPSIASLGDQQGRTVAGAPGRRFGPVDLCDQCGGGRAAHRRDVFVVRGGMPITLRAELCSAPAALSRASIVARSRLRSSAISIWRRSPLNRWPRSGISTAGQILDRFLADVVATLDPRAPISQDLHRIIADGEHAVAEWTSHAQARNGAAYDNDYAVVFRVVGGKIAEVTEYCDTSYMKRVLFDQ